MTVQIIQGDCLIEMPKLSANSMDAIVTDPPYGLSFMGKDWDHGIPGEHFWHEALRVAKPERTCWHSEEHGRFTGWPVRLRMRDGR